MRGANDKCGLQPRLRCDVFHPYACSIENIFHVTDCSSAIRDGKHFPGVMELTTARVTGGITLTNTSGTHTRGKINKKVLFHFNQKGYVI